VIRVDAHLDYLSELNVDHHAVARGLGFHADPPFASCLAPAVLDPGGLRPGPWRQDHHRGLHGAAGGIGVEVLIDLAPPVPQALPLLAAGRATAD
jgi:hypothetical protein